MKRQTVKIMAMLLAATMMLGTVSVGAAELEPADLTGDEDIILVDDENTDSEVLGTVDEEAYIADDAADASTEEYQNFEDDADVSAENDAAPVVNVIKYNIKFDKNGADCGKMGILSGCQSGTSYKLPFNKYARAGYRFNGWNTRKNGKGKKYNDKASVKDLTKKNNDTVTLYAQWKKAKKADFILKDSDLGDGVVVTVKNNTSGNYKFTVQATYYKGNQLVTSGQDTCDCLQSKTTCALRTKGVMAGAYDSYTVKILPKTKSKWSKKTKCYAKKAKISYKKKNNKKKVEVTLSKLDKNIKNAEVAIVFYKGKKVIGYDFWDDYAAFKGKSTKKLSFKYPKVNGKVLVPDKCKVYLNEAYYAVAF